MQIVQVEKGAEEKVLSLLNNRTEEDFSQIDAAVADILVKVAKEGDAALAYYSQLFDGAAGGELLVDQEQIEAACQQVEPEFLQALEEAAENIRAFHQKELEKSWTWEKRPGVMLGQLVNPVESAGVYVPGGKAAYPSTVLMNVIPAKIAGVPRIVMVTPPGKDGTINPYILAAAKVAGADEVYAVGGAQAIAALAYGTETIRPVNKITGPGNIYVARAKKAVFGLVDIDMIAGPSEICILGDTSADPIFVAADMLSQAEHDEMAAAIFVTTCQEKATQVAKEVEKQLAQLERQNIAAASLTNNGLIAIASDTESQIRLANLIAPEHLELLLENPLQHLGKIRNAGAVFVGPYSPEPLGDYYAGPNHTLPTGGTAKFASPLGVYDFLKKSSIIYYSKEALSDEKDGIIKIAQKERLTAHGNAIAVRFPQSESQKK